MAIPSLVQQAPPHCTRGLPGPDPTDGPARIPAGTANTARGRHPTLTSDVP
jgi:hypothetical protein